MDGGNENSPVVGRATFDTACPYNIMSRKFAERCGLVFNDKDAKPGASALGNNKWWYVAKRTGRWVSEEPEHNTTKTGQTVMFPAKFMRAEFLVSQNYDEAYDVIIGLRTMRENKIHLQLAAPVFGLRKQRESVDCKWKPTQQQDIY
jgi:hypothetical protein